MTTESVDVGTPVAGENAHPENPETGAEQTNSAETSEQGGNTPTVEHRDGKLYVDGRRVYTRDDTNQIAANTRREIESRILEDLGVDSLEQVQTVISELRETSGEDLNVRQLQDQVRKKEKTVEELQSELETVRTELVMNQHLGKLHSAMPTTWNDTQRDAVIDLMKSRGMLQISDDNFAIVNGDEFLTDESGEKPDYHGAVQIMAQTLGLNTGKRGVDTYDQDRVPGKTGSNKPDRERMKRDPSYNAAYVQLTSQAGVNRDEITDSMVQKHMDKATRGTDASRMLYGGR